MARKNGPSRNRTARSLVAGVMIGMGCLSAACDRAGPLTPDVAQPPDGPSRLLNPLCTSWTTQHLYDTISTAVTWQASGNPHQVIGHVALLPGGTLTLEPGTVVCFQSGAGIQSTGGRLYARGLIASPIVFTAYDPAQGWAGMDLKGAPPYASQLNHGRVEYVGLNSVAISAAEQHRVFIDSTVVRQSGAAVSLWGRSSRFGWSRVDTTTNRYVPAVVLGDSGRFTGSTILRAAGVGMLVDGTVGVGVNGGRIEGSGGVGIRAPHEGGIVSAYHVRVVGGLSYPIETTAPMLQRLYGITATNQDSLKGNARDTVVMLGGTLNAFLWVRAGLPWHVKSGIVVLAGGTLAAQAGAGLAFDSAAFVAAGSGGRVQLRGAQANPVVLTADDPARGWQGISLSGTPPYQSYITNARVEHVAYDQVAIFDYGQHPVRVDSTVLRWNGSAVDLGAAGSRLNRSRVDTTLAWYRAAVRLHGSAVLESTLIRGSAAYGVEIHSATVQVLSCEVRESTYSGILMWAAVPVHNCNLVDNLSDGLANADFPTMADATDNWWGDAAGPWGPNGDGAGYYVTYTPWRTTPYVLPYVP